MISYRINQKGELMKVTELGRTIRLVEFLVTKPDYPEIDIYPEDLVIDLVFKTILNLN